MAAAEGKTEYKRSHSAMNTKVLFPAFNISGGKVVGAGEGGQLPEDPFELVKSFGIVGEVCARSIHLFPRVRCCHSHRM
jgi:hypothetical protein